MANSLIGNSAVATHMYQALYGQAPSNGLYNSYIDSLAATSPAAFAATMAANFANVSDTALALQVLNNLGVTATTVTATGEYTKLLTALGEAFAAFPTMRGQVILNATNLFGNLEADPTYGVAATTYNKQALANFTYASNTANTAPGVAPLPDPTVGSTFTLTAGVDSGTAFTGGAGNDTFVANKSDNTGLTLTSLDSINGGGGSNVLNAVVTAAIDTSTVVATVKNIQTFNLTSGAGLVADLTAFSTGVETLTAVSSGDTKVGVSKAAALTAAATTAVSATVTVLGDDTITVDGGAAVTVTDTGGTTGTVDIGGTTAPAGAVTVTHTGTGALTATGGTIQTIKAAGDVTLSEASGDVSVTTTKTAVIGINDGASVTVSATATNPGGTTGGITIGKTTAPSGAIAVTSNLTNAAAAATNTTGGDIAVAGGTSVSVTQAAAQSVMSKASTNSAVVEGGVKVIGGAATTTVTLTNAPTVAAVNTVLAVAGATTVVSEAFTTLANATTLAVGGLTFTNTSGSIMTAAQVAAAFANLAVGDTQGASILGTYTGIFADWTTGAATSGTVVFTTTNTEAVQAAPVFGGGGGAPTATTVTTGVAVVKATGTGGVTSGAMTVSDVSADSTTKAGVITTVTLDGYGAASTVSSNALTSLTLANSTGNAVTVVNNNTSGLDATTLGLTVNKLGAASTLDLDNGGKAANQSYKALNITTTGSDSTLNVTGAVLTALTVTGTKAITLTGSTLTALKTVTVTGSAGVTAATAFTGAKVTDVNAAGTSGKMSATIVSGQTTYEGGTGVDTITFTGTAPSKALTLGDGNDTLTLAASTTTSTAVLDGGNGTDTIKMDLTSENNLEAVAAIQTKIVGFEVLNVTGVTGAAAAIDMSKLGFSSITVEGIAAGAGNLLTLSTFGNGGTLTINADIGAGATGYTISNAAFTAGAADAVNVVLGTAVTAAGTVTAAKVETVNITANDKAAATMTLTAADATTVTVAGAGALTVTPTGSTALTAFDATNSSGGVTYTSLSTKAETITGGSGADVLTAAVGTKAVTIVGGAGNDTITANGGLDTLTGGAGKDTFVITTASANVNSYATIVDAGVGDKIKMTSADSFAAASLSLAETAVFQDYANLAISGSGVNDVTWFQYGGNTYVVENLSTAASFQNGTDFIVKLTGAIDLSTASFSTGSIIQLN